MDYILFVVLILYFIKGLYKGFVSMLLSLFGISAILFLSWSLVDVCMPFAENLLKEPVFEFISNVLDRSIGGSFGSMQDFELALNNSNLVICALINEALDNVSFEGELSAGQILAPTLTNFILKAIVFVVLFIVLFLLVRFLRFFVNKILKNLGLSVGNRLLGGVVGLVKGMVVFIVLFSILLLVSNILFIEPLNNFVQGGKFSNFIYEYIIKMIY